MVRADDPVHPLTVVMAESFVAMPFLIITVAGALRSADQGFEEAAATLGAKRMMVFRRITVPMIAPSLGAGAVLCWARALGEFGATITFAGSFPGQTETMPIAVYYALENDPDAAIALSLVLLLVSIVVLISLRDRWLRGGSAAMTHLDSGGLVDAEVKRGSFTLAVNLGRGTRSGPRPARAERGGEVDPAQRGGRSDPGLGWADHARRAGPGRRASREPSSRPRHGRSVSSSRTTGSSLICPWLRMYAGRADGSAVTLTGGGDLRDPGPWPAR